jgi:hypothetical protein
MLKIEDIFLNDLTKRSDKWYPYFHAYEKHLGKFRGTECKLLEIGVQGGGSLEMWHHYFGDKCSIHGVDCDETVLNLKYDFDVDISIGDQEDVNFWKEYSSKKGFFDIIIDDGGHTMKQQENTVLSMFKKLNYGGVYIIEDTHTSYWEDFGGGFKRPGTFIENMKMLIDLLHSRHIENEKPNHNILNTFHGLSSMTFYDSMVVLEKEIQKDFKRFVNNVL